MKKRSSSLSSNQYSSHRDLDDVVRRHQNFLYQRPFATYSHRQFDRINTLVNAYGGPVILDSGCGNGEAAYTLADEYPDHLVIGIDKSEAKISAAPARDAPSNLHLVRGNCVDIWRLAANANWPIRHHFLLYPNPWPKAKHLKRRWHGHPVFSSLLALGGHLELRSNWKIYVVEFSIALEIAAAHHSQVEQFSPRAPLTPFERKYAASGHPLYRLRVQLS
ncbi:MAG TPA: SAM-dependent methyltransferase [Gammaproteobacteria bacterium]|nr:SAM-dependent methyltransferase [Gammaproteobacteria bacterium]|tara:strand:+ start:1854 stop:2513 length:660 start_codon:yes stop_codon:yes gene_type:complete